MWSRRAEPTLAFQFLLLQLAVVALLLLLVGAVSVRQSTATFTSEGGAQLRSVSESVANTELVRADLGSSIEPPDLARRLAPPVDRALQLSGASIVYVVSPDGIVAAATDPSLVGEAARLGDSDALPLGRGWTGDVRRDDTRFLAAHAPVLADDGDLLGIVVTEQVYPSIWDRLTGAGPDLVLYLGLGAVFGTIGSYLVSRVVRRRTQGLGASEFATLADHRKALLYSIREGVIAVGTDGRVTMINDAAREALVGSDDPVGRHVDELGLDPRVADLVAGQVDGQGTEVRDAVALIGTRVFVFNRGVASAQGRGIGTVTTLRDRTELLSLQTQLSTNLSITDTLRAQTHEFDNRLHTISGLLQLGEYDEAQQLVGAMSQDRAEAGDFVSRRVRDPAVAALFLAKLTVASERGVRLELDPGSSLPALDPALSADLTTVLGNLIDNAVDASAGAPDPSVEVWSTVVDDAVHLRVRDTGPGVPEGLREAVFVRGYSTKEETIGGRGIGLPLVRLIATQRGGSVEIGRAAEEGGAEFRLVIPYDAPHGPSWDPSPEPTRLSRRS